eukprot:5649224-Amphidinium_carterae.1
MYGHEVRTVDFSVAFMFKPVPEDVQIFVEAPPGAGLQVSSRPFQDHLASILRAGGFEQSTAETPYG